MARCPCEPNLSGYAGSIVQVAPDWLWEVGFNVADDFQSYDGIAVTLDGVDLGTVPFSAVWINGECSTSSAEATVQWP